MNFLINRSDAIGDTLLTMPMAKMIKEYYPEAKVVFIVSEKCKDLFIDHPFIDDFYIFDHKSSFVSKLKFMKKLYSDFTPDVYLHVGGSHIPSFYAWKMGVKERGGLKSKWQTFAFLNKGTRQKRSMVVMHESDYNLNLLENLGMTYLFNKRSSYAPVININDDEKTEAMLSFKEDLKEVRLNPEKELIFIHPGMTGHTLNWSSRNYARLILRLEDTYPDRFNFIISFTPSDAPYLEGLKSLLEQNKDNNLVDQVYYFNGIVKGLRHYMAILSQAKVFVGPSTGTTHIASTLDVGTVGIYSPIKVQSAFRWAPFQRERDNIKIVIPDVVCGEQFKCAGSDCPYYECMAKIEVDDILVEIKQILEK